MLNLVVPLPVLPAPPDSYSLGVVTLIAGAVGALGIIGFLIVSLTFERLLQLGGPSWSLVGITLAMLVGGLGVAYLTQTSGERAATEAFMAHSRLERAARLEAIVQLEDAYGVTFEKRAVIPVTADDRSSQRLTFPDRHTEDCFVVTLVAEYEIRCGGVTVDASTALAPVQ